MYLNIKTGMKTKQQNIYRIYSFSSLAENCSRRKKTNIHYEMKNFNIAVS